MVHPPDGEWDDGLAPGWSWAATARAPVILFACPHPFGSGVDGDERCREAVVELVLFSHRVRAALRNEGKLGAAKGDGSAEGHQCGVQERGGGAEITPEELRKAAEVPPDVAGTV